MNDIRRTILWVVFSMSLFLIWDAWNKHTGQPSMFAPPPVAKPAATAAAPGASGLPASVPTSNAAANTAALPAAATAVGGQRIDITTDLFKATLDTRGADLVRVELLRQVDPLDHAKNMVLLDQTAERLYVAQTGLVPPTGGAGLPNHHSLMKLVTAERALKDGSNELQVRFESDEVGGVKLVKT